VQWKSREKKIRKRKIKGRLRRFDVFIKTQNQIGKQTQGKIPRGGGKVSRGERKRSPGL